ncbi:MAG TPA: GNAT family N-acetyltransferase [Pyrinomonadaceae bacterium]
MTDSVHIREATRDDAPAVAKVHVLSWQESFVGIVPDAFLERLTIENRTEAFRERFDDASYRMFVAEHHDAGIVGFADVGHPRYDVGDYDAELYAIYLFHEFQGKGIGALLFERIKAFLIEQGKNSMYLLALEVSPYRPFYEKMGGQLVGERQVQLVGIDFRAVVYGWETLR